MTLKIEILVPEEYVGSGAVSHYIDNAMSALGFGRYESAPAAAQPDTPNDVTPVGSRGSTAVEAANAEFDPRAAEPAPKAETPQRERGKPSPGKARRTKEEIAEDEAADAIETSTETTASAANISTGEERIDPTSPEDAAQDAADEAAEVAGTRGDDLTLDDLRKAVGVFQKKFGMAYTVKMVPKIIGCDIPDCPADKIVDAIALLEAHEAPKEEDAAPAPAPTATKQDVIDALVAYGEKFDGAGLAPPQMANMIADRAAIFVSALGKGIDGLSKIPDRPEAYGKAVAAIRAAIENNPYGREAV
jgi:hypothetical protein